MTLNRVYGGERIAGAGQRAEIRNEVGTQVRVIVQNNGLVEAAASQRRHHRLGRYPKDFKKAETSQGLKADSVEFRQGCAKAGTSLGRTAKG